MISKLILIPVVTAFLVGILNSNKAKYVAALGSFVALAVSVYMAITQGDYNNFREYDQDFYVFGLEYIVEMDGLSALMVMLTTFLTFVVIISTTSYIKSRIKEYCIWLLLIASLSILVFTAQNLLLFYIAFELILIPMCFIIGIWGGDNRIYACMKFFLYTFLCSIFMLLSIIYIGSIKTEVGAYVSNNGLNFDCMKYVFESLKENKIAVILAWIGVFIGLAAKIPMIPVHTWLPDAHVQAPTGGSMILAGILLKLGGYGMIKIALPLLLAINYESSVETVHFIKTCVYIISVVAIIYGSMVAFAQKDIKKVIAYSSIAHMGYVTAGVFSETVEGYNGAVFQMISHGIVSSGLFFVVGVLYERMHTKDIGAYGGFAKKMPWLATFFMILMLASVGLPGTSGFIGEILSTYGLFKASNVLGCLAALGVILSAVYMLHLYKSTMFGNYIYSKATDKKKDEAIYDLNLIEIISFTILSIPLFVLGIYPKLIINFL